MSALGLSTLNLALVWALMVPPVEPVLNQLPEPMKVVEPLSVPLLVPKSSSVPKMLLALAQQVVLRLLSPPRLKESPWLRLVQAIMPQPMALACGQAPR